MLLATYGAAITAEQVEREWREQLLAPGRAYRPGGFSDVVSTLATWPPGCTRRSRER